MQAEFQSAGFQASYHSCLFTRVLPVPEPGFLPQWVRKDWLKYCNAESVPRLMLKGDKLQASVSSVFDRFEVVFFRAVWRQTTNGWMIGTLQRGSPNSWSQNPIPKFTWHSFIKISQRQVCFILNGSEFWEMKQDVTWPVAGKFCLPSLYFALLAKASMVNEDRRILASGPRFERIVADEIIPESSFILQKRFGYIYSLPASETRGKTTRRSESWSSFCLDISLKVGTNG